MPRALFKRNGSWDLLQDWPKSSLLEQCAGAPFFLQTGEDSWLDTARKTLATSPWPGFLCFPLVSSVCPEIPPTSGGGQPRQFSHTECDSKSWRICLNVSHFSLEEVSVKTNEGYLEITGKHEEMQDGHGVVSRSFTRKYKLPPEVDLQQMSSSLSEDGVLVVEAPLCVSSVVTFPAETVIPIEMKQIQ